MVVQRPLFMFPIDAFILASPYLAFRDYSRMGLRAIRSIYRGVRFASF